MKLWIRKELRNIILFPTHLDWPMSYSKRMGHKPVEISNPQLHSVLQGQVFIKHRIMLIDSHSHPQFPQYDRDRNEMIRRSLDAGIQMIAVGTDYEMSAKAVVLANQYEGVWASVGLHPNDNLREKLDLNLYRKLAQDQKIIAIGEVGLDFYRTAGEENIASQKERLVKFLELAAETGKPLIMHCREAYAEMLEMLDGAQSLFGAEKIKGVVHSFTSNWEMAQNFLERGFYLGFNGIVTFTDQYNETIKNIPLDKLLLETDAPYLSPVPHRGRRNESSYLNFVAEKIAELKNLPVEELAKITTENAIKLFELKK